MVGDIVLAFDLYGTLLSTESIAQQLASHFPEKAHSISSLWRRYQLEYTWRLTSMGVYESFSTITRNALRHALAEHGETLDDDAISALMEAYDNLSTFPDVKPTLTKLASNPRITPVVFSNGTQNMVSNSVHSSPDLSPHASVFSDIISIQSVRQFKPAPATYFHLAEKVGKASRLEDIWLVSGNPFDIVGARSVGLNAVWVDRAGKGWMDAAVPRLRPTAVVRSLEEVSDVVEHQP
ncbi:HAD-like domain-containing protein [Aspergillus pseudodeflectus]|uniref:HAD-like domain-containing protein n=1 Tax=Aspergillus pseudodeflectus TaxID=176178 RepID=A0ABR4K5K4_9EURO